jgi:hypothetical protein
MKGDPTMSDRLVVYVPASQTTPLAIIVAPGSAIIGPAGSGESDGIEHVSVDYEGAVYGQVNIKTYADRARHAADRQLRRYPTVARCVVLRSELRQVGWFDPLEGVTLLAGAEEVVASWLGVNEIDPKELQFSSPV